MTAAPRIWRSFTFRLALLYLGLFGISIALILGGIWWFGIARPLAAIQGRIAVESEALARTYQVGGAAPLVAALAARTAAPSGQRPFHVFVAPDGRLVAANLATWPRRPGDGFVQIEADVYVGGEEFDHVALLLDRSFADGARLLVGRDVEFLDDRSELIEDAAIWIAIITLILGIIGGLLMSLAVGRRVEAVGRTARRVIDGELGERVPVRGTGDDFDQLAETLNAMLDRIETLIDQVRRVSDSVAHELRTPLTRLRADLEDLHQADGADRQRLLDQAVGEAARLQSLFDALLRIARIESGRHGDGIRSVDLSALLADVADYHQPAIEEAGQGFDVAIDDGLVVEADPDLLFQAIANLLDNAMKHAPAGGRIALTGTATDGAVTITVADNGPGIPPEHLSRVTERFYRAPETAAAPGAGLGLSLVAAVAQLHHAELWLSDNLPGLAVELRLPHDGD